MSTAIVWTYIPEGFVIGADGLRREQRTGDVVDWQARKIFSVENEGVLLAYAWAGAVHLLDTENWPAFSFLVASAEAGAVLKVGHGFADYVQRFCGEIAKTLNRAKRSGKLAEYPVVTRTAWGLSLMAECLFVGYFRGEPCMARVQFSHANQVLINPELVEAVVGARSVATDFRIFSGSEQIYAEIKPTLLEPQSLQDAANLVRGYIQKCSDNRDRLSDCKDIGGHIHIAAVTMQKFEWIAAPVGS